VADKAVIEQTCVHMLKSTSTQRLSDQNAEYSTGLRILEVVLVLIGFVLVSLSVLLPILMETVAEHRGVGATFISGYLRSLTPFITNVSMASSFVVAAVILSFEKSKANVTSVLFGVLTLSVFATEISLSLYLSLVRPLTASAPNLLGIYALIGLVPFGLGFTMFTLTSIMSAR